MPAEGQPLELMLEESDDLHADAMRATKLASTDLVEIGKARRAAGIDPEETAAYQARRRGFLGKGLAGVGLVAGAGFATQLIGMMSAAAQSGEDVQAAQTAASLENLAVAVYKQAAGLDFMQNIPAPAGPTVVAFVTKTIEQHTEHGKAFNAVAVRLGGKAQTNPNLVVMEMVVNPALPTLKTPLDVVRFAATLEWVAGQTYAAETAAVSDKDLRNTFASIGGVESQHRATLLAVAALLEGGAPELIAIPTDAAKLPAAAGSVGFPDAFQKTDQARPAAEGAVK